MLNSKFYCLQLENFGSNIQKVLKNLQNETQFCDVFLACDDQQFKVHGVILSSVSPVLSDKIPQHVQNEDIINRQENYEKSQMFDCKFMIFWRFSGILAGQKISDIYYFW